jgi:hypothetical protein
MANRTESGGKTGRPSKLTPELTAKVVKSVEMGIAPDVACAAEGISNASYWSWKKQGQEGVEPYATFWSQITRAIATSEVLLVQKVSTGDGQGIGFGEAKASLELLQRRFPKRWSVQLKVEMADQLSKFIDAAQRVCSEDDFRKLLEVLAEEPGEGEAPGDPASPGAHVH